MEGRGSALLQFRRSDRQFFRKGGGFRFEDRDGIRHDTVRGLEQIGYREAHYGIPEKEFPISADKANVKLLGTGGTIASRLDYRTGAVIPAFSPSRGEGQDEG